MFTILNYWIYARELLIIEICDENNITLLKVINANGRMVDARAGLSFLKDVSKMDNSQEHVSDAPASIQKIYQKWIEHPEMFGG